MKKILLCCVIVLAVVGMAKSVPDKKAHKKAMMEAVKEYVDEEAAERGLGNGILSDLGKGIVNKTIEVALNSKLEVDNYLIFNTTHVQLGEETKTLSLGILGHVFTFDKQMLRDALEASAKEKAEKKSERKAAKEASKEARKLEKQLKKEERKREKEARKEEKRKKKEEREKQKNMKKGVKKLKKMFEFFLFTDLEVPFNGKRRIDEESLVVIVVYNKVVADFNFGTNRQVFVEVIPQLRLSQQYQHTVSLLFTIVGTLLATPQIDESREGHLAVQEVQAPHTRELEAGV